MLNWNYIKESLYRSFHKGLHYCRQFFDTTERNRMWETYKDFLTTKRLIGRFIGQGNDYEDTNKYFAVLSMTSVPMKAKFYSLLAKVMQFEGYSPVIINSVKARYAKKYFRLFGFNRYIEWEKSVNSSADKKEIDLFMSQIMPDELSMQTIKECLFREIPVGIYALSSACRRLKQFPTNLNMPFFKELFTIILRNAIASVIFAERFFASYPVKKILIRDIGYVPNGCILDVALRKNIDCLVVSSAQRLGCWTFKRYTKENYREHEFSISQQDWNLIKNESLTDSMNVAIEREFKGRYMVNSDLDVRRLQYGKREMSPEEIRQRLGLNPSKKTVVIFAHISWDGAFFFGEDLFDNFDDWLLQTTQCAIENTNLNWIVKLHPLNVLKHAYEGKKEFIESEMIFLQQLGSLPPHIKIMHSDTPINSYSLFKIIDYGITVRGTIGLELPCFGIPVLTAGTGRYEGRGFTIDSNSRQSYFSKLRSLHNIPPLDENAVRLARIHFYYLMLRRQVSFEDIAPMEVKALNEAYSNLFDNIYIKASSLDDVKNARSLQAFVNWAHQPNQQDFFGVT